MFLSKSSPYSIYSSEALVCTNPNLHILGSRGSFYKLGAACSTGVEAFADALLAVPKTLAENSGLDTQDVIIAPTE
ncbi:hypothetical protein C3L33_08235, partial [Rhododendron williamsianum]